MTTTPTTTASAMKQQQQPLATATPTTMQENSSTLPPAEASTPHMNRPLLNHVQGPPTPPTDYEIMTESCDWCMAETPWEADLFGSNDENDETAAAVTPNKRSTATPPKTAPQDALQVNLLPRQTFGIPIM